MRNYKHLSNIDKSNSYDNILTDNLPSVALRNTLTTNIILSMESLLVTAFSKIDLLNKYFSH